MDYLLLRSQTNDVLRVLQVAAFQGSEFQWEEERSDHLVPRGPSVNVLVYKAHPQFFFKFDWKNNGNPVAHYAPGNETALQTFVLTSWSDQLHVVLNWANYVQRETQAPDLWAELARLSAPIGDLPFAPDRAQDRFAPEEVDELKVKLKSFQRDVAARLDRLAQTGQLTAVTRAASIAFVQEQVQQLSEATGKQTRLTWYQLAIGVAFTIALGLPPETRSAILHTFASLVLSGISLLAR